MADHHIIVNFEKEGAAFNTADEAMEAHFASIGNGDTIADYNSYAAGSAESSPPTGVTSTRYLTSNGEPVSSGTAGNGYAIKQIWTEDVLKADIIANGSTDTSGLQTGGWTVSSKDINPDTGVEHIDGWHLLS